MRCPICKQPAAPPPAAGQTSVFPFCSERCKLIDLGRWLEGRYQIPVESDDAETYDASPNGPTRSPDDDNEHPA